MHQKLPIEIDPFRLAQNGLTLEGQIPLSNLSRLTQAVLRDDGMVDVKMVFDIDQVGTPFVKGRFHVSTSIICERCMEPMVLDLDVDCLLAMVVGEQKIEGLAEQYDPWVLENSDPVLLKTVVEDELILSMPLVPRHESICLADDAWSVGDSDIEHDDDKRESPFAVLSSLKTKK
jgi:uncharacterized protein